MAPQVPHGSYFIHYSKEKFGAKMEAKERPKRKEWLLCRLHPDLPLRNTNLKLLRKTQIKKTFAIRGRGTKDQHLLS